jgi:hypothetical protein
VAVYADYVDGTDDFAGLRDLSAFRGRGTSYDDTPGSAGTLYLQIGGRGELIVDDNESGVTAATGTPLPLMGPGVTASVSASATEPDTLGTDGIVPLLPNALVGLRLNPDLTQGESFEILSNTADSITVATPNGNGIAFSSVAAVDKTYAGYYGYENLSFRRGGHLVVGDLLAVSDNLRIAEDALLTHPQTDLSYEAVLDLQVDGTLEIDATSRIDVSGRGYLGGTGSRPAGQTLDNEPGAQQGNGGSYGGDGGHYSSATGYVTNPLYGSLTDPVDLGSGGGIWSSANGGDGGGRILITVAGDLVLDGVIRANGGASAGSAAGHGSGGSVNIVTGNLTGAGTIEANGGSGSGVGGGGGRIAVRYSDTLSLPITIQSLGGTGNYGDGTDGTLHTEDVTP